MIHKWALRAGAMPFPPIIQPQQMLSSGAPLKRTSGQPLYDVKRASMDKDELSNSWPSATLRREMARRQRATIASHQHEDLLHPARRLQDQVPRGITGSYESVMKPRTAAFSRSRPDLSGDFHNPRIGKQQDILRDQHLRHHGACLHQSMTNLHQPQRQHILRPQPGNTASTPHQSGPFSLCLAPEAILIIQRRNFEKQLLQRQQQGVPTNTKRIFACSPVRCPRTKADAIQLLSPLQRAPPDVRDLIKISLLNDQHRYDDEEYEDDDMWLRVDDEGLMRRCTEWLRGVEIATAKDGNLDDKLQTLPHLNT
ncbi:proline-rich protein 18 [Discoglossus pictus]